MESSQPVVLPIRLLPSNLRPLAYRILSKKHGLNIKSDALKTLADFIGPKFGSDWKAAKSQMFIEEVARLWKEQERGIFIDAEGLDDILKDLEALESKNLKDTHQVSMDSFLKAKQKTDISPRVDNQDAVMADVPPSEDERTTVTQTSPATSVTPPPMRETFDWREYFKLISAYEQPLFDYNSQRKQYEQSKTSISTFSGANIEDSVHLHRRRYHIVRDRLLRNEKFQSGALNPYASFATTESNGTITQIKNLLGRNNQQFLLLGMLTLVNNNWHLEDPSDSIQLNLDQTEPNDGLYYTQGNIVLCDGVYSGGVFYVTGMGHPPAEKRAETLEAIGNIDFLGIHANMRIDRELHTRLKLLEREYDHKMVILGSDCFLDDFRTLEAINRLFTKLSELEDSVPITIVFNGSFSSIPLPSAEYKGLFDSLAEVLEKHPVIAGNVSLVFVPGENDHWQTPVWPKQRIPKLFGSRLSRVARSVQWASNPARMVYLSQEIVLARDDISARFRRNSVVFPLLEAKEEQKYEDNGDEEIVNLSDNDAEDQPPTLKKKSQIDRLENLPTRVSEARKLVKTILDQGHISPFTKNLKPVVWHLDHTLHLSPLPNVFIISDPTSPAFDVTYHGCKCLNAGAFIEKRKMNYIEYGLNNKRAEIKELYF